MNSYLPPIDHYIWLSSILFSIGVMGVLIRRNGIVLLMCVELMLNAVNLLFTAFSTYFQDSAGQIFVFFIIHKDISFFNLKLKRILQGFGQ